ncbi:MAG: recombinase family protein [Oscillospiraceae bacterium]|nr:recombinase family protein [Oscillospiraceae bacterium]
MNTAIYVRVSTEEQAKEGYSIRAQIEKLKSYIQIKDWTYYKVYADEGISGKNITDRPAMNELIADIEAGRVHNVLVYKIDRLTRNTRDLIDLSDLFQKHNCAFNSLMESIDTKTASGRMFLKIIGIFAEFERENIIERITLACEKKVKEGYTLGSYTLSYGYDVSVK